MVIAAALSGSPARGPPSRCGLDPGRRVLGRFLRRQPAAVLLIVVTTIGMLVHVYSIGYMRHDPGYWRFFAYLNLFMVSSHRLDNWLCCS